eukprot:6793496-Pyramimonas_sp.AAC.2
MHGIASRRAQTRDVRTAPGICSLVPCDWFQPLEYALQFPAIGSNAWNMLSSSLRLVPTTGICSLVPCPQSVRVSEGSVVICQSCNCMLDAYTSPKTCNAFEQGVATVLAQQPRATSCSLACEQVRPE